MYTIRVTRVVLLFFILLLFFISKYATALLVAGAFPSIFVFFLGAKYRYLSMNIFCFNVIGVAPFMSRFIKSDFSYAVSKQIAHASSTWATIYASVILGQIFYFTWPKIFFKMQELQCAHQMRSINQEYQHQLSLWEIDHKDLELYELFENEEINERENNATTQL